MYPLINVFGLEIQSYSVIAAIGFLVTMLVAVKLGKHRNITSDKSLMITALAGLGVIVGGHFLFALTNIKSIVKLISGGEFSFSDLIPYTSGMVFYGGLFGAIAFVYVYCFADKSVSRSDVFDVFAVSIPLFHAFGRVGCFFAGCCYGVESEFGITTYLNNSATHYGVCRFPVALVEAFVNLIVFAFLLYLFKKGKLHAKLILIYLSVYAPARFVLEYFRADDIRGFIFGLSTSQLISFLIVVFLIAYLFLVTIKKRSKRK